MGVEVEVRLVKGVEGLFGRLSLDEHRAEDGHFSLKGLWRRGRILRHALRCYSRAVTVTLTLAMTSG